MNITNNYLEKLEYWKIKWKGNQERDTNNLREICKYWKKAKQIVYKLNILWNIKQNQGKQT